MSTPNLSPDLNVFDPTADYQIIERKLPHWSQPGVVAVITWRTDDSIPADVLKRWRAERHTWLFRHGIEGNAPDWRDKLAALPRPTQIEFYRLFSDRWHDELDTCHGECVLRLPELAKIVADMRGSAVSSVPSTRVSSCFKSCNRGSRAEQHWACPHGANVCFDRRRYSRGDRPGGVKARCRANPKRERGRTLQATVISRSKFREAFALADASSYFKTAQRLDFLGPHDAADG